MPANQQHVRGEGVAVQTPKTAVEESYKRCLDARRTWIRQAAYGFPDFARDQVHADLHAATMEWFETLHPYSSERQGDVQEYWSKAPLWPIEPQTTIALWCPACGTVYPDDHDLVQAAGNICEDCSAAVEHGEFYVTDDDGHPLYEWETGLATLEDWQDRTRTMTVETTGFKKGEEAVEVPERLTPEVLKRIARYLDQVAQELNLLADTDREMPIGALNSEADA